MSKVALSGNASGTGTFTIASPNSNSDRTLTLPDATGTILTTATPGVPVNGPAFSAYPSSAQTLASGTFTKIQFNAELFDTNSNYDTTNYRFTPTVAGYYNVLGRVAAGTVQTGIICSIYKNGSETYRGDQTGATSNGGVSALMYLNGSTDYIEIYALFGTGQAIVTGTALSYFQAFLARSAT